MFSTKISDLTKNGFLQLNAFSSVLLLRDLTISTKISDLTKMTFSSSIQLKIIKISTFSETQEVIKMTFSNSI